MGMSTAAWEGAQETALKEEKAEGSDGRPVAAETEGQTRDISPDEVAENCRPDSAWVILHGSSLPHCSTEIHKQWLLAQVTSTT